MTDATFPVSLALFDFVPSFAFLIGAFYLVKISLKCRGNSNGRMVMAGTLFVFLGGFTKALWKFLVATKISDIFWLGQLQFILTAIGFLGMCVAVIYMVRGGTVASKNGMLLSMAIWKIPFLFVMTLASLGAEGILAYLAFRSGEKLAGAAFAVGVMGLLAMGALASAEQTISMQWIEEIVNTIGQSGFMLGSILLNKNFEAHGWELPPGGK
jgi:hypothetical protein